MIKKCQIEERLAVAISNYVRTFAEARRVRSVDEMESVRILRAERRKILGGIESTFHKLGGDPAELQARLDSILIPGAPRLEVSEFLERLGEPRAAAPAATSEAATSEDFPNMTPEPERDTVAPEVDECDL